MKYRIERVLNWLLDHTGKRWREEQDRIVRVNVYYDTVIGQHRKGMGK